MRTPNDNLDDFKTRAARKTAEPPPALKSVHLTGEVEVVTPLATAYDFAKHKASGMALRPSRPPLSWFHSSLAVGGVLAIIALVIGSVIFIRNYRAPVEPVTGPTMDVAINQPPETLDQQPAGAPTTPAAHEEPTTSDIVPTDVSPESSRPSTFDAPPAARTRVVRSTVRSGSWTARSPKIDQPLTDAPSRKSDSPLTASTQPPSMDTPLIASPQPKTGVLFAASQRPARHLLPRPTFVMSDFTPTTLIIYVENGMVKTRIEPWLAAGDKPSLSN